MDYSHSYDFVNNGEMMDIFKCKICHSVSKDPYETQCCKNTFCKSCIDTAKKTGIRCCPLCRRQPYQIVQAVQISRQIESLQVYCENRNQGCTWIGTLQTKNMHLKECPFEKVPCEYQIVGCNATVTRIFQMQHNINEMKTHFSMVAKCVEEKLKLNNSTKQQLEYSNQKLQNTSQQLQNTRQQLAYSERRLNNIRQELNESNRKVKFYMNELEDTKRKLADSNNTADKLKFYFVIIIFFFVVVLTSYIAIYI